MKRDRTGNILPPPLNNIPVGSPLLPMTEQRAAQFIQDDNPFEIDGMGTYSRDMSVKSQVGVGIKRTLRAASILLPPAAYFLGGPLAAAGTAAAGITGKTFSILSKPKKESGVRFRKSKPEITLKNRLGLSATIGLLSFATAGFSFSYADAWVQKNIIAASEKNVAFTQEIVKKCALSNEVQTGGKAKVLFSVDGKTYVAKDLKLKREINALTSGVSFTGQLEDGTRVQSQTFPYGSIIPDRIKNNTAFVSDQNYFKNLAKEMVRSNYSSTSAYTPTMTEQQKRANQVKKALSGLNLSF